MFCFIVSLHSIRAEKRAAWRQNRLKTLEEEAAAAQQMIQSMDKVTDDDLTKKNEVSVRFVMSFD